MAIDFPAECECADVLAAEIGLDRALRNETKAALLHCEHESVAREVPAMLVWLKMLTTQRMLDVAEDRQREEQPFAHIGDQRLEVGDRLEHIPKRRSIERNQMRIDE